MNELILHTGTTKTGTTSLQGFFSANREKLAEQGVAYPSFTEQPWPDLLRNGTFLNRYHLALARGEGPYLILNDTEENLQTLATSLPSHRRSLKVAPARTPLRTDILLPLAQNISRAHPDAPGTTPFDEETTLRLMKPYLGGNKLISERYLDGEPLFSEEYGGRPVWIPNEGRTIKYRAKSEKAVQRYRPPSGIESASSAFASKLPEGFKRPLKAVRKGLLSR